MKTTLIPFNGNIAAYFEILRSLCSHP